MEAISIMDGLVLTVVSMLVVFAVLTALWGITEWTAKLVGKETPPVTAPQKNQTPVATQASQLVANPKHQLVAELMALTLASQDQPNKKLEIHESIRIK